MFTHDLTNLGDMDRNICNYCALQSECKEANTEAGITCGVYRPKMATIKVKYLDESAGIISPIRDGEWYDIINPYNQTFKAGEFRYIPLGFCAELPYGYEAKLLPRSSTFERYGLIMTCSMGVIDNAYNGELDEWKFPAFATKDVVIPAGSRIAQFRVIPTQPNFKIEEVKHLNNDSRGGFGSTGI